MSAPFPRIGPRHLVRLLGEWRPEGARGHATALADRVRLLLADGRLGVGARLPAERELAGELDLSRTTVAAAYEHLRAGGHLRSRRGSGSWTTLPAGARHDPTPFSPQAGGPLLDLAHAAPPAPPQLAAAAARAADELPAYLGDHGYHLLGLPALREALAARFTAAGAPTTPDQIVVTSGGLHALSLVLATLVAPGERVLVEHPTYPNALEAVARRGARAVPVPMAGDPADAWDVDGLAAAVRDAAPRLAYLIPDCQNPTGAVMPAAHRAEIVDLARRTGTPLVIDETMVELPLDGPLPAPVTTHAPASRLVVTVGSASKVFWGGLRIGWIRGPVPLVRRLAAARAAVDLGAPVLDQLVVEHLLADVDAIAAARRAELALARDHLRTRLAALFPHWRTPRPPGGLSLWTDLGEPVSGRLAASARRHGLLLAEGSRFGLDGAFERYLRLPYALPVDGMEQALTRLTAAWAGLYSGPDHEAEPVAVA